VVGAVLVVLGAAFVAFEDQVDLEVGARDRRLDARGLIDVLVFDLLDLGGGGVGHGLRGGRRLGLLGRRGLLGRGLLLALPASRMTSSGRRSSMSLSVRVLSPPG